MAIDVTPAQAASPVAVDDSYMTTVDTQLVVDAPGVLANDEDPDGNPLTSALMSAPLHGTITLSADGWFIYTPDPGFEGSDSFSYQASSDGGTSGPAIVHITVEPPNQTPTPTDDEIDVVSGEAVTFNVLDNDSDPDGDPLTVQDNTQPPSGSVQCGEDGSCTYSPESDFVGDDAFTYTVSDGVSSGEVGTLAMAEATVTITVTAAPTTTTSPPSSTAAPTTTIAAPTTTAVPPTTAAPSTTAAAVVPTTTTTTTTTTPAGTLPATGNQSFPVFAIALLVVTAGSVLIVFTSHGRIPRDRRHSPSPHD